LRILSHSSGAAPVAGNYRVGLNLIAVALKAAVRPVLPGQNTPILPSATPYFHKRRARQSTKMRFRCAKIHTDTHNIAGLVCKR
jgi:hypothetical protein